MNRIRLAALVALIYILGAWYALGQPDYAAVLQFPEPGTLDRKVLLSGDWRGWRLCYADGLCMMRVETPTGSPQLLVVTPPRRGDE